MSARICVAVFASLHNSEDCDSPILHQLHGLDAIEFWRLFYRHFKILTSTCCCWHWCKRLDCRTTPAEGVLAACRALRHPFFAHCVCEEAAAGGDIGEAAAAGLLTVEQSAGVNGCRAAAEADATTAHNGCEAPPIPAATAAKPPLPRFAPSKRQCLRSARFPRLTPSRRSDLAKSRQVLDILLSVTIGDSVRRCGATASHPDCALIGCGLRTNTAVTPASQSSL